LYIYYRGKQINPLKLFPMAELKTKKTELSVEDFLILLPTNKKEKMLLLYWHDGKSYKVEGKNVGQAHYRFWRACVEIRKRA
jgi:hypothetical protein